MLKRIVWSIFFVLIIYPIILSCLVVKYYASYKIGLFEISLFIAGYYGSNIAVGVGLHRLWSHHAFKTNKVVEFILVMMSAATFQGPVLSWASNHYKHHTYTDKDQDPHSPLKFENRILGFLWSHIGWMIIDGSYKSIDRVTMVKLGKNKFLRWQLKHYWQISLFMNTIVPALIGYLIGGTIISAYAGFLFIGMGRALQQHATFCVNSLCHFVGSKKYYKGTAGDIWWMALFLLGENWHNFHHAFPSDYRNGAKWYHFDVHKWIIYVMSKLGLAWNLEVTPEVRIQAKVNETSKYLIEGRKQQLSLLQDKINQLGERIYVKLNELENSSISIKVQLQKSFIEIQESLKKLAEQLHSSIQLTEESSERLLKIASKKIKDREMAIYRLYNELDRKYVRN
ncbi:acyl-CoA desaturase [Rickettsia endosymbiont of Culicoides newsteadi]|uniref:acyl-CoA desaturase n=1 Tax=Rickettsia endosymbiont of Culicoides newsteadi TaxID=1961830 RepID=UPI000B9C3589|nr:acyl-CoA desaturase [Rickettsia endosymbiont of Culicoides newsteadi]OZG31826.1 acyl-CoA desaturase [Rickettsia endosymbiont of Culicoides newsteadi]